MTSLIKSAILTVKRTCRLRFGRWSTTLFVICSLLIVTLLLISLLPTGVVDKKRSKTKIIPISPKFKRPKQEGLVKDFDDKSHKGYYGTKYAYFVENVLGNFEPKEKHLTGRPGDEGQVFKLDSQKDIDWNEVSSLKSQYGMNLVASNLIPMDRSVPDLRHEECKYWHYDDLPTASVVIVFHNEGFSTLMRTVHSVLIRSPRKYLREVVLVDDYSDKEPLKAGLDRYIVEHFGEYKSSFDPNKYEGDSGNYGELLGERSGKVRLVRNTEREGLIRSRTRGAEESVGDVVVFLDAHCECNYNWLPPLLAPIAENRKTVTVPIIDGIDHDTFHYRPVYARNDQHFKGIWEWGMYYKELEVDMEEHLKKHKVSEPYDAPTHAGGLFAIERNYFMTLGGYDPGLLVWGGENFELSFKVWQCGGRLQWIPCSRVGHIYRPFMPYTFGTLKAKRNGSLIITNYKRVIETWWDQEYKEYFYTREPLARYYYAGDYSKQIELKNKLKCKSFDWFMTNVAYDVYKNFPKLPPNVEWGEVKNAATKECLDTGSSAPPHTVHTSYCHSRGGNQLFRLNAKGQLGVGERCIDANQDRMTLIVCKLGTVDGPWRYDPKSKHLVHTKLDLCLQHREDGAVHLSDCDDSLRQQWVWKKIRP
ncbi:N-acetylgalactosaminyltransferase 7-like protein [Leptotrombidium deliense]|uniref:Polypeptide N-acetylgalactosaminyltransferase n=1 Tax=Leptotrombidium deliense TaxID=299467 RepID=A0A443SBP6_9ACAR|nr:N-acetylgalactosaminyltransferase 7-like protein [Leptotrombidium deliense]